MQMSNGLQVRHHGKSSWGSQEKRQLLCWPLGLSSLLRAAPPHPGRGMLVTSEPQEAPRKPSPQSPGVLQGQGARAAFSRERKGFWGMVGGDCLLLIPTGPAGGGWSEVAEEWAGATALSLQWPQPALFYGVHSQRDSMSAGLTGGHWLLDSGSSGLFFGGSKLILPTSEKRHS